MKASDLQLTRMTQLFQIEGQLLSVEPHKSGHINDTYLSSWSSEGSPKHFIHQRINEHVFKDIPGMMRNIELVTNHLREQTIRQNLVMTDQTLTIVPAKDGQTYARDEEGKCWRTFQFIEGTQSFDVCTGPDQAKEAARTIGRFQYYLQGLEVEKLIETIPNFVSSPYRFMQLREAIQTNRSGRAENAKDEIAFALEREEMFSLIVHAQARGEIPVRVCHSDMKLNNILFSKDGKGVCVVDLDTCMPGYSLFDFADLARSTTVPVDEDEQDLSKVQVDLPTFQALVEGYLEFADRFLTPTEHRILHRVPPLLALTLGSRFLADFLNEDIYFKVKHPMHNLERARTQFAIVDSMEHRGDEMREIVQRRGR